ncbi:hypothetical protein N8I77_005518 [Diaporthe amygdali]|uniref:Uncharacterized protein n=1 Tax=Phomopsis amygdali TaxID=1214568 RepID=A0AAD9SEL8_PHOAM|nr:hypothetical protein N8I77_005518 [Diaporthe amygdali]
MTRKITEANKAWEHSASRGEMEWLKDTTFVSAEFFQPPSNTQPHGWERIAVPPATSSHGGGRIFKRVPGRSVDTKYNDVAAELDSQGFGERKRAKMTSHKAAWGLPSFDPRYRTAMTDQYDIGKARYQVKRAYKEIAEDNEAIRKSVRPSKRSTFEPSQLTWTPRKRHNTRWPVNPPKWDAPMIAEYQPLIIFEISTSEIDDPAFWEQEDTMGLPQQEQGDQQQGDQQQTKKLSRRRRSIVQRPSLSTISEEYKEPSGVPSSTPSTKYRPMYSASAKRWSAAAEKYYTSLKVASSPLQKFTMSATPRGVTIEDAEEDQDTEESSEIEITNERGHFRVPSSPLSSRSATTAASNRKSKADDEVTNERGRFRCPSSPVSSRSGTTTSSNRKRKAQNEIISQRTSMRRRTLPRESSPSPSRPITTTNAVAVFDQPTPEVHTEPEHETKRRVSLDNARRSDRRTEMAAFKKVRSWVANTFTGGRRRSFAETLEEQEGREGQPRRKRRHTLDVDVGRNPDIFGQTAGQQQDLHAGNDALPSTTPDEILPRAASLSHPAQEPIEQSEKSASTATTERIPQTETQAEDARTPSIENGVSSVGVGAGTNVEERVGNFLDNAATAAAQDDSISEAGSEFSMVLDEANPESEIPLEDTATPPTQTKVAIDWDAITNIDDKIRDLLDRKAALVYNETIPVTKEVDGDTTISKEKDATMSEEDDGDTTVAEEDETQPFEMSVLDRIMSVLEPDEDEDITMDIPEVNTSAADLPVTEPPTTDSFMADSPVADSPTLHPTVPHSSVPDLPIAMETTVETASSISLVDIPISVELAAMSQPAEDPDNYSNGGSIIEPTPMNETPICAEPEAMTESVEAPGCGATPIEPVAVVDRPFDDDPAAKSHSTEVPEQIPDAVSPNIPVPSASTIEKPTDMSQSVEAVERKRNSATSIEPTVATPFIEAGKRESDKGALTMPTATTQPVEALDGDSNDDSEYAMLHSFVRRAQLKPKRKEFTTSSTGSPNTSAETNTAIKSPRQPLGQKDANRSPSPSKKRKLKEAEGAPLDMTKNSRLVKPDLDDTTPQPLRKRRRKGAETDSPDEIFNPEMALSQSLTQKGPSGGPRRSKRVATTKTTEPATPSHIPVRLPGSFDADMPAVSTASLMQRKTEKDLATLTRTNTRRNKGGALPVPARLAGLSLPAETAAAAAAAAADPFTSPSKSAEPRAARRGKAVRWDETLARFQGDSVPAPAAVAEEPTAAVDEDPTPSVPAPVSAPVSAPVPVPVESEKKKALRPRASRLPAAKTTTTKTTMAKMTPAKTKSAPAPAPSRVTPAKRSGALGARLGTPAPKRRGSGRG